MQCLFSVSRSLGFGGQHGFRAFLPPGFPSLRHDHMGFRYGLPRLRHAPRVALLTGKFGLPAQNKGFQRVERFNVPELPFDGLRPGNAHDQQGKGVAGEA